MSEPTLPPSVEPDAEPPAAPASAAVVTATGTEGDGGTDPSSLHRYWISGAIVIILVVAAVAWLLLRDNDDSSSASGGTAVSVTQVKALPKNLGHPIFWLGRKEGMTYELTQTSNGSVYIRYLPAGVEVGAKEPYLTVATYPFPGAYAALQGVVQETDATEIKLPKGGIAEAPTGSTTSVHAAYPGVDYQIEVFDPTPGTAEALVKAGQLSVVGKLPAVAAAAKPVATSPTALKALATSLGHPIYWAGTKEGTTYELLNTSDGKVYIRYLPAGTPVGDTGTHLTVATYPYPGAFAAVEGLAKAPNATVIKLEGGGIAVIDKGNPQSIHLAYPGVDYQIEVYDPSAAAAKQVVAGDQVESVG